MTSPAVEFVSTITCPQCGAEATETMPENACRYFYECLSCHTILKPIAGDCCVFCSFATLPCPPKQRDEACCC